MDDKEYEIQAATLYQVLGEATGAKIACYGATCRVEGKSGTRHQIDVLVEQSNGLQTIRTAVECKFWNKKVPQSVVSNLVTTLDDTAIEKGAIVSKEGFTSGAIALAKRYNIGLVEMREPLDKDWEGKIRRIHSRIVISVPEFTGVEIVQNGPPEGGEIRELTFTGQEIYITQPGREPETVAQVLNNAPETREKTDRSVELAFPPGTIAQIVGVDKIAPIDGIRYNVRHHVSEQEHIISGDELVHMIVREVFQKREFVISREGQIRETAASADG